MPQDPYSRIDADTPRRSRGRRQSVEVSSRLSRSDMGSSRTMRVQLESDRRGRTRRRRAVLGIVAFIVIALLVGAGVAWAWWSGEVNRFQAKNAALNSAVKPILSPATAPSKPFYMVLMGTDMRSTDKVGNSDSLMVAYVDPVRKRVDLMSIPRDTRVQIPGHGVAKINSAALIGGPALTIRTVKELTGLPISHYVVVNFWGFKDIVNAIGGVWINVPTRINDIAAANHDHSAAVIDKGYQKLDGKHALTFVRARHQFAMQDLQRVKDQQAFLKALAKQTLTLSNVPNAPKIIDAVMRNITTDFSVNDLLGLEATFKGVPTQSIESATMPGTARYVGGVSYVVIDRTALASMVSRMQTGQPLKASAVASSTAATGSVKAAKKP